ncbi:PilN domain-containing protein [Kingella negevensis]|uniref:PilN domain-containing protein n=1 Tax=Kingella negevensis TaxID=1522312 RepID=UPI0025429158|nr:PilN domain-containing protein [Kingella negevensis]WII92286.1 PilN domain-containing protein [Kingella negevensis]
MKLIQINLLPYREMEEQKKKKKFQLIMAAGALAGIGACAAIYLGLTGLMINQESRNESLQAGIKELDKQLTEIKELNKQKQSFLARKLKVEELDHKRFEGAYIIDTLNQLVPEGAYLAKIQAAAATGKNSNTYSITGKAISDNKVAMLMTALPSTGIFEAPKLISIKKTDNGQEFVLEADLVEQKVASQPTEPAVAAASQSKGN